MGEEGDGDEEGGEVPGYSDLVTKHRLNHFKQRFDSEWWFFTGMILEVSTTLVSTCVGTTNK